MSDAAAAPEGAVVSAGALLREARERSGMHIGALAVGLKVPVKKIEALEADRLDLLPDAVFARALASSIARTLKVDAAPILAALPQGQTPGLAVGRSVRPLNSRSSRGAAWGPLSWVLRKPAVLVGSLLVAGALALVFVPKSPAPAPNALSTSTAAGSTSAVAQSGSDASAAAPGLPGLPAVSSSSSDTGSSPSSSTSATPLVGSATVVTALLGGGKTGESAEVLGRGVEVQAKSGNTGLIRLIARGLTWVEVTDAAGVVQLRTTLTAGENASAGGILPLKVVVGRVDMTQVQVRGKPFDMAPFGKDNVARFEVR